jgi:hypothetical protein
MCFFSQKVKHDQDGVEPGREHAHMYKIEEVLEGNEHGHVRGWRRQSMEVLAGVCMNSKIMRIWLMARQMVNILRFDLSS